LEQYANGLAAMKDFASVSDFVRFLGTRRAAIKVEQNAGMKVAGDMLARSAKDMIGHEGLWQPLADSTVEEKRRLGYAGQVSETDPLLRTGQVRDSIASTTGEAVIVLGATDPIAKLHEDGTMHMPARPVIGPTMFREGHEAAGIVFRYVFAALTGSPRPLEPGHEVLGDE
jgi:hypothetical protein